MKKPGNHRLPVRPLPHVGESIRGYVLRLSARNRYPFPAWLYDLEPNLRRISNKSDYMASVEKLTGHSSLEALLVPYAGPNQLPDRFHLHQPRICPECVKERGRCDAVWEVAFACACPYHGIFLVEKCPVCSAPLSWNRKAIDRCNCGGSLVEGDQIKADPGILYLNARIWIASGIDVPGVEGLGYPDSSLAALSLEQLCACFRFLSSFADGELRQNRLRPGTIEEALSELGVVHSVLSNWPAGMSQLFDNHRDKDGKFVMTGLHQAFGKLYRAMYSFPSSVSDEKFDFLRKAFEDFVTTDWVGVLDSKYKFARNTNRSNDCITLRKAAKRLGIGFYNMKLLYKLGVVTGTSNDYPGGRKLTVLTDAEFKDLEERFSHRINREETRALLGISEPQFNALVGQGFIKPLLRAGENGITRWWCDSREVEKLLSRVISIAPHHEPDPRAIPFMKVCQWLICGVGNFLDFLAAVESGRLPVAGVKAEGKVNLSSLYFLPEEIAKFRAGLRMRTPGINSVKEAAVKLGIKDEVAYHLVRTGWLPSSTNSESKQIEVTDGDIQRFQSTCIALTELAAIEGVSVRRQMQQMADIGVMPVLGPRVDGCAKIYYLRADLPNTWASGETKAQERSSA